MSAELDRIISGTKTGAVRIPCHIQPRSSRCKISGVHGDAIKIALTAPPVDGKANTSLIEYLSEIFSVPKSRISIVSGETGRNKVIEVSGSSVSLIADAITKQLSK